MEQPEATLAPNVFEERAENLSREELQSWTFLSSHERAILRKLTGPGAKLISGPRGSGKSTLLRHAYYELLQSKAALPIYVNYSRALALEPLFHSHANAQQLFRQWVLAKLLLGVQALKIDWPLDLSSDLANAIAKCERYVHSLEAGTDASPESISLSPSSVSALLAELVEQERLGRCVLLLDDAAHAFSLKQQREFFEVFRELRSRTIAAKAAIYPGVTSFSPTFHVGHEAEVLEAWFRPDSEHYLQTMREIAARRIPADQLAYLGPAADEHLDLLALAAFGLPRGYLNMLGDVLDAIAAGTSSSSIRKLILDAIDEHADSVRQIFRNVADKLPRFKNFITVGEELEREALSALRAFNKNKPLNGKAVTLALSTPFPSELERILQFMEYAGLARRMSTLSKGVKGSYERYSLHYATLISSNALSLGRSFRLTDVAESLKKPSAHSLVKTKAETLLGSNFVSRCVLALPPCARCQTPRMTEEQRFCMNCGNELSSASVYFELLAKPVDVLPLPAKKIAALKAADIASIQQLLADDQHQFRKPGSHIGPIWARRIRTVAEEFISV